MAEDRRAGSSPPDRWLAFGVFALGALLLAPGALHGIPFSKAVLGAQRILAGELPYRDFWTMYAPGQFYANAALLRFVSGEILVVGLAAVAANAAAAALFFALLRGLGTPRAGALLLAALFVGAWFELAPALGSYCLVLPLLLAAWLGVLRSLETAGRAPLLAAGLAIGAAACFKHDVAAYTGVASVIGLAGSRWLRGDLSRSPSEVVGELLPLAAGALLVLLPALLALGLAAGPDAWADLIVWPAGDFRLVRTDPYPGWLPSLGPVAAWLADPTELGLAFQVWQAPSRWLLAHLPELAFLLAAAVLLRQRQQLPLPLFRFSLVALAALPFFWWAAHTQPNTHVYSMAVLVGLLAAPHWPRAGGAGRAVLAAGLGLYALALLAAPVPRAAGLAFGWAPQHALERQGVRGIRLEEREARYTLPIADFIEANVPEGERIYVGVRRHDMPVIGNLRFYVMTGRLPAVRHHEIHPGIHDDRAIQGEIMEQIEAHGVRSIVLWRFAGADERGAPEWMEERAAMRRSLRPEWSSRELDGWIDERFEPVFEVDEYQVLWRRGLPPPLLPDSVRALRAD